MVTDFLAPTAHQHMLQSLRGMLETVKQQMPTQAEGYVGGTTGGGYVAARGASPLFGLLGQEAVCWRQRHHRGPTPVDSSYDPALRGSRGQLLKCRSAFVRLALKAYK